MSNRRLLLLFVVVGCSVSAPSMRLDALAESVVARRAYSCGPPHARDPKDPWESRLASLCTLGFSLTPAKGDTFVIISRDSSDHVLRLTRVWMPRQERAVDVAQLRTAISASLGEPVSCDSMPAIIYWRDRELLVVIDSGMPDQAIRWSVARAFKASLCDHTA